MFIGIKGLGVVGSSGGGSSGPAYDSDAQAYIDAVETADGQSLEADVKDAYNNFFVGLKDDGLFNDIDACCLIMGARTIAGALTPLVSSMPTPTNNNFVSGDYSRTTGLQGDGSTKYINSNTLATETGTNDCHLSVYEPQLHNNGSNFCGVIGYQDLNGTYNNAWQLAYQYGGLYVPRAKDFNTFYEYVTVPGFSGLSRNNSANFTFRFSSQSQTKTATSSAPPFLTPLYVMAQNHYGVGPELHTNGKLSFYSIGASLNLVNLESRVKTLVSEIGAALP
jgi:hypothetical protein